MYAYGVRSCKRELLEIVFFFGSNMYVFVYVRACTKKIHRIEGRERERESLILRKVTFCCYALCFMRSSYRISHNNSIRNGIHRQQPRTILMLRFCRSLDAIISLQIKPYINILFMQSSDKSTIIATDTNFVANKCICTYFWVCKRETEAKSCFCFFFLCCKSVAVCVFFFAWFWYVEPQVLKITKASN